MCETGISLEDYANAIELGFAANLLILAASGFRMSMRTKRKKLAKQIRRLKSSDALTPHQASWFLDVDIHLFFWRLVVLSWWVTIVACFGGALSFYVLAWEILPRVECLEVSMKDLKLVAYGGPVLVLCVCLIDFFSGRWAMESHKKLKARLNPTG